jgi:hypothetical protein
MTSCVHTEICENTAYHTVALLYTLTSKDTGTTQKASKATGYVFIYTMLFVLSRWTIGMIYQFQLMVEGSGLGLQERYADANMQQIRLSTHLALVYYMTPAV